MADTNPPQGSPGAPSGQPTGVPPNAVPKIELSQIMDVSKFQRDLADTILNSFGDAGKQVEGLLLPSSYKQKKMADLAAISKKQMDDGKKFADAEMLFLKQVSTKQRFNYEQLRQQKAAEYAQLQKAGSTEKQLNTFKLSAEKQLNMAKLAAGASEGKAASAMGLQVAAAGEYLTSMGAVLGVWEAVVATIMRAFEVQSKGSQLANSMRSGGLIKGAGGASVAKGAAAGMFAGVGNYDSIQKMEWVKELAKVPVSLETTGGSINSKMKAMIGTLGTEFASVDQIVSTLAHAADDTGMTMEQLTTAFKDTKVASNALKIDHLKQLNTQIQMRAALRGVTTDAGAATEIMNSLVDPLKKIGATGVSAEITRLAMSMAKFAGGMSITKMSGMYAFTHGGRLPTDKDLDKVMEKNGPVELMTTYFKKLNELNPNSDMKYAFAQKAAEANGLQLGDARQVKAFAIYLDNLSKGIGTKKSQADLKKEFGYKDTNEMIAEGLQNLAKQRNIQDEVTALIDQLMDDLGDPLLESLGKIQSGIDKIGSWIPTSPFKTESYKGPAVTSQSVPNVKTGPRDTGFTGPVVSGGH
jgi:hypothetical protein